jgi:formylglycine-generating enzyme required for sulfatase activity
MADVTFYNRKNIKLRSLLTDRGITMKRLFTTVFLLSTFHFLLSTVSFAQTAKMSVNGKPQKSSNEIVGKRDSNGKFCAAVQVVSDMDGFKYQSYNGVVAVDDQPGRDMVYLSPNERVLEIFKSGYEPLKLILSEYGIQLKEREVWQIKIIGSAKTGDLLPVTFLIQPRDALISVDGKSAQSGQPVKLSKGSHTLRISKQGFKSVSETINVSENKVLFNFTLSEVELEQVLIKSVPTEARIYLDNVEKGVTDKGLFLYPGQYRLKLSKTGYLEVNKSITVSEGGNNTFSYTLSKNSGSLSLNVTPSGTKVLINKEDYSNRSNIEIAPGRYKVEISKIGYKPQSETISIVRGQTLRKTYNLIAKTGKLQFNIQPLTAKVTLKKNGRTVDSWTGMKYLKNLQVGSYELECTASGYGSETKKITINEQQTAIADIKLSKGSSRTAQSVGVGSTGGEMVFVKGGTFQMGSTNGDGDEKPVHSVTVDDFYMSKYEVTFAEYDKFCEATGRKKPKDQGWGRGSRPVINVSWHDAAAYCQWAGGRLPTEAEWEYAARGGNKSNGYTYAGSHNADEVAWYNSGETHPVGQKKPNELGLYDMSGNVWEWCSDWYDSDYYENSPSSNPKGPSNGSGRVRRGGSWYYYAKGCRVANRSDYDPSFGDLYLGFRLARPAVQ